MSLTIDCLEIAAPTSLENVELCLGYLTKAGIEETVNGTPDGLGRVWWDKTVEDPPSSGLNITLYLGNRAVWRGTAEGDVEIRGGVLEGLLKISKPDRINMHQYTVAAALYIPEDERQGFSLQENRRFTSEGRWVTVDFDSPREIACVVVLAYTPHGVRDWVKFEETHPNGSMAVSKLLLTTLNNISHICRVYNPPRLLTRLRCLTESSALYLFETFSSAPFEPAVGKPPQHTDMIEYLAKLRRTPYRDPVYPSTYTRPKICGPSGNTAAQTQHKNNKKRTPARNGRTLSIVKRASV